MAETHCKGLFYTTTLVKDISAFLVQ